MEKTYQPQAMEQSIYQRWENEGYFAAGLPSENDDREAWSLMIPPPNVTGSLHMGHAFQDTIMDCLTRYHRMKGYNTLWQPGTDHAGIATQMLVERKLLAEGIKRAELGRDKFIEKVWEWKNHSGSSISHQLRRMGTSVDWQRERFTMDKEMSEAVIEVFVRLYREGLIYRGKRLVNWDPKLLSAISDLEVINKEEQGFLYHVRYPLVDGMVGDKKHLLIATTRPETILADGALAVNPADERYKDFIGKMVWVPMTDRKIPIIVDDYVDPDFGTGCVKITPAHDFNDYQVGERHTMEVINLFTPEATMNDNAPPSYRGMDRFVAREKIIQDLHQADLLEKVEDHKLKRPYGDRSGVVIEPYMTDQWFVKANVLAEKAIEVVKNKQIEFIPENWQNTYFQWLENIQDWCISRQLWWGHRIPVWYTEDGASHYVANDEEAAYQLAQKDGYSGTLRQDDDVLDTWFSSALWPFSTLGWPNNTEELKTFYPTSVLVTGFDIIFFWVARMIMFGVHFTGEVPFRQVYVHGLVRDGKGDKMSKSKGNVLDPIDIIDGVSLDTLLEKRTTGLMQPHLAEKITQDTIKEFPEGIQTYGCDALRFTFVAMTSTGRDIRFELNRCAGYRNFCNKLWNSARFAIMKWEQLSGESTSLSKEDQATLKLLNGWIESRLHQTIQSMGQHIEKYRFDLLATTIYDFVWHDFCDWYIEMTKPLIDQRVTAEVLETLFSTLDSICRIAHPIIPFITEEIWTQLPHNQKRQPLTLMCQTYPIFEKNKVNLEIEEQISWLKDLVTVVRSLRSKNNINPTVKITILLENIDSQDDQYKEKFASLIKRLCNAEKCETSHKEELGLTSLCRNFKITVPFEGAVDVNAEIGRLKNELQKSEKQLLQLNTKLSNKSYLEKAPQQVVEKTRENYQSLTQKIVNLKDQLDKLSVS